MRNSTMRFANKLCITIALSVLVVCIATFAFLATAPRVDAPIANAALSSSTTTTLNTGLGLQYGTNFLRTTSDDFYAEGVDVSNVGYTTSGIMGTGSYTLVTKPEVVAGSTSDYSEMNPNTAVYYGILDEDISTTFTYSVDISARNVTSDVSILIRAYFSSEGSSGGKLSETQVEHEVNIIGGTSVYNTNQSVSVYVNGQTTATLNCHLYVETIVTSGSNAITFSNPNVFVSAESNQLMLNANTGVSLSVSGANRKTVTIANVYSPTGMEQLANLYVKEGDTIIVQTALMDTNEGSEPVQVFSPYYAAAFGRAGSACVDWYTYYNKEYSRNKTYLARIDEETHLYMPDTADAQYQYKYNAYQGFYATFKVTSGVTNATTLQIIPRLMRTVDGSSYDYWLPKSDTLLDDVQNYQININVDNSAPTSPKLDATKTLGLAIANKEWYTASDSFELDYEYTENMDREDVATEYVYAFIVSTKFSDFPTKYDFTPGSGASYTYTAGNEKLTVRRNELGAFSNDANAKKNALTFTQAGEYGLILYAVDDAGNVSSPTLYTPNQINSPTVKVDASTMEVGAYIKYGDNAPLVPTISNKNEFTRYANVYVLAGSQYHDENGVCNYDINDDQPGVATSTMISVKRGIYVTVRIIMTSQQFSEYSLVRCDQGISVGRDNPPYVEDKQGNRIYDVTFKMDDALWTLNATTERPVLAYFHRRVDLRLLDDDFTYTYENNSARKITFASLMQAYFEHNPTGEVILTQPKIAVEYFKLFNITIKSEFIVTDSGQTVLQGGGNIVIDGTTYDIGADFNQNEFVRGSIPFIVGDGEYYVRKSRLLSTVDEGGIAYRNYELTCYNLNAGNAEGYSDAGDYVYRAYVVADDNTHFYGEKIDGYTIKKADPGVLDPFAKNILTYGQSLGELIFSSYDLTNNEIPVNRVLAFGSYSYQMVSSGVFGTYVIEVPTIGSDDYNRHIVATNSPITVVFRPVDLTTLSDSDIKNNFDILKDYFEEVYNSYGGVSGYRLKEGVQTAVNYNPATLSIPITVVHKTATVTAIDASLNVSYDGYEKHAEAFVTTIEDEGVVRVDNQPLIFEYKLRGASDDTYTKQAPEQAGQYTVRIIIDSLASNYVSDYEIRDMIISKRELTITIDSADEHYTTLDIEMTIGNASASEMLTYTYSHTQSASYLSGYFEGEEFTQVKGLLYRYSFFKQGYYNQNSELVELQDQIWSDPIEVLGATSLDAGLYMMRVEIDNLNHAGEKYIVVDVKQVRRGDVSDLSISSPSVRATYEHYELNDTYKGLVGHLEYGDTLADMRDTILGNSGSAKHSPRGATNPIVVNSRFVFETEQEYVQRVFEQSGTIFSMDVNGLGQPVFPMNYNESNILVPYTVRILWQAGTVQEGVFVPNNNFRMEEIYTSIYVVRAVPDFSDYGRTDITYGQTVGESQFTGTVSSHGFEFGESDFTMTLAPETLALVPFGGENTVSASFAPSEELIRKYRPVNNVQLPILVNKREVEFSFELTNVLPGDYDENTYQNVLTHVYGALYENPATTVTAMGMASLDTRSIVPEYIFLRNYSENEELKEGESLYSYGNKTYVNIGTITPSTPVGSYFVVVKVQDGEQNFTGSTIISYYVIKGTLYFNGIMPTFKIQYGDNLLDVDFGSVTVANDPYGNYNKFFAGTIKVAYLIDDEYVFDYCPDVYTDSTKKNAYLIFEPTGTESVVNEYNKNFRPYVGEYYLEVAKRDLSGDIVVEGTENLVFDLETKEITASLKDPVTGEDLPLKVTYLTDCRYAGNHQVDVAVDSGVENYTGYTLVNFNIAKAEMRVNNKATNEVYNAKAHSFKPDWETDLVQFATYNFTFNYVYRDYTNSVLGSLPIEIGRYTVDVQLVDDNFFYSGLHYLYVTPDVKGYKGLEQTYSINGFMPVTPEYNEIVLDNGDTRNHPDVDYKVEYKSEGLGEEYFTTVMPFNAGTYDVRFTWNQKGYVEEVLLVMVVSKAEANLSGIFNEYKTTYTGEALPIERNPLFVLPESVTNADYYYKKEGAPESEYTLVVPTEAGSYDVKIVLDDLDYKGEKVTRYFIDKATLEVKMLPNVSSDGGNVFFNTPSSEVEFTYHAGDGTGINLSDVQFPLDPTRVIEGKWELVSDVSAYRVGERTVQIVFLPTNPNFYSIEAETQINIVQKDISEHITFQEEFEVVGDKLVIRRPFIAEKIGINPILNPDANLPYAENVYFTVTYGDTTTQPVDVVQGGYAVTVTLSDANYSGYLDNVVLVIEPATDLTVVLPEFRSIEVGGVLNDKYVINSTGGVYIASNNRAIQGRFTIVIDAEDPNYVDDDPSTVGVIDPGIKMTKANLQPIEIQFIPDKDVNNVSSYRVRAYINVIGDDLAFDVENDIVITSGASKIIYGAPLSSYNISIVTGVEATVEWANPEKIVNVGELVEFIMTPNDYDTYNVKRYYATLNPAVQKAEMYLSSDSAVVLYEGQAVRNAMPQIRLFNEYLGGLQNLTPEQEAVFEISNYEYTISSTNLDYVATSLDLGNYINNLTVTLTITHPNYETLIQEFPVFVKRQITEFNVANKSKYYDGNAVTIKDLGITLVGTTYIPNDDEVVFKNIVLNGVAVSEIRKAGTYTVTIAIVEDKVGENGTELNGSHVGEYTFTYVIEKRDLSEHIDAYFRNALNQRVEFSAGTTYAEYVEFTADFLPFLDEEGNVICDEDGNPVRPVVDRASIQFMHYSRSMAYSYGTLPPTDAGDYVVVVNVNDAYYVGSKTYEYSIVKRLAEIQVDAGYYYTYDPNGVVNIVPVVSNNISSEYLQILYKPLGSNVGTTEKPVNVGNYEVVINIVNHPNVMGSATTRLTISSAPVMVEELPVVNTSLKYGTMLKHVGISGGIVEAVGGARVDGTFAFMYPETDNLPVGANSVQLVFTPYNSNYGTTTCSVTVNVVKALLNVEFTTLERVYTGEALYPGIDIEGGIKVNFTFRQGSLNVDRAVEAGVYEVTVNVTDANYEGSTKAVFTIHKATAIESESALPTLSAITYGNAIKTGTIEGGRIVYVSGKNGVLGTFRYLDQDTILGDVGIYDQVKVLFTPTDTANYENFIFTMPVEVVKANATLKVSANAFTYGESITSPVFSTVPQGLNVDNSKFDQEIRGTIQRVGTYVYTAYINEKNYQGEITYAIEVYKKKISIAFYRDSTRVDSYTASYGLAYSAKAQIVADTLVGDDVVQKSELEKLMLYHYTNLDTGATAIVPPTTIGNYTVTAVMEHNDYYIDRENSTVNYTVTRATVSSIEFDLATLSDQVYGSVSMPVVITSPTNVGFVVEFPGYDQMPTSAGNYSIKVTIQDENYFATERTAMFRINPKEISLENIKAYSKAYDGLPDIEVTGELKGVMSDDEVKVSLRAHTLDNKVNVGAHSVVLESWGLYGLHAKNYSLRAPLYNLTTTITNKVITDPNTSSYITSPEGFSSNITVSFQEVYDTIDNTNFFTQLVGQKATVQVITVKENGLNTVLDSKVKFYVLIPEEYRDAKNLTVEGLGNLENAVITREGDYVTFYADASGEIIFYKNDFPYWVIIVGAVILMIILGGVFALIALPLRRRHHIARDARSAYTWNQEIDGREHAFRKKVEQEIIERKRRWRY